MMDLAISDAPSTRHDIANRHNLPVDFMDQIISRLKVSGLVSTTRGRSGGLKLSKSSEDVTLWDIFSSVEDQLFSVLCLADTGCLSEDSCVSFDVWRDVYAGFASQLKSKSLAQIVAGKKLPEITSGVAKVECKAPKKGAPSISLN